MLTISVVIPSYNDSEMLRNCLAAIARQTRPADEVVVVDNGSTDDTTQAATAWGARVVQESERGIPAATAAGFDAATGQIFARLDADSVPRADWLARIEEHFMAADDLAAVTGPGDFYGASRPVKWFAERLYIGGYFWFFTWRLGHPPLFGSNFAIRASAWLQLREGSHREVRTLHDDLDLSYQFAPGQRIVYDPALVVGVSARPFASPAGLIRRVWWGYTTAAANREVRRQRSRAAARE
ncbi:glycosyltransferase family A protein [Galbitalea soli]|uniref:4,4'-diaponeurosporenoate glycosyltransferase n=1 Tax=Galbitalea soli TaxID=1268042 RepID=A0A7C9TPH0_9MICO|nr:glycosyltransferase family A protein [Galbitalea soli]NEM90100.1 glycosyltransferase family 2 protein [Galbitalea soli]NYJ30807.1 glycosyltransferase involved in cell wall biosynthesis [Galbitalea soli]